MSRLLVVVMLSLALVLPQSLAAGELGVSQQSSLSAVADQPLAGREFGAEFNFASLLLAGIGDTYLSGTFSRFYHGKNVEIAMPYLLNINKDDGEYESRATSTFATVGVHYRKFINRPLGGLYFSGFAKLVHLEGSVDSEVSGVTTGGITEVIGMETATEKELKFGVGVGIGYRYFSNDRLYWGTSLSIGRYLTGDHEKFDGDGLGFSIADSAATIEFELLKFGYAF